MSITLLHKLKLKTLNFEAIGFNILFKLNSQLILKLTVDRLGGFWIKSGRGGRGCAGARGEGGQRGGRSRSSSNVLEGSRSFS